MSNRITYGLEAVRVAFRKTVESSPPEYDAPIAIPGAVRFTPTAEGDEVKFYADNIPYFVVTSNNGYSAELEMALVPDSVIAAMLGWGVDANGMLIEDANAMPKHFALMGQVQGDSKNRRFVYYDCVAARPDKEHKTKTESFEPDTDVLKLSILPIEIGGVSVVKGVMELGDTNASAYNAFFDAVTLPEPAVVSKTALDATIALAGKLLEGDYTPATWDDLAAALTAAGLVSADGDATQQAVNNANAVLQAAILALEVAGE